MRLLTVLFFCALGFGLSSCATNEDEEARSTREAGGSLPWNRPEKWEGGGALGSQINQFNQ